MSGGGVGFGRPAFFSYWRLKCIEAYTCSRCEFFALSYPVFACQEDPSGGIMHVSCLFRAATKQRTCALSDTLSARVLLAAQCVFAW